MSKGKKGHCVPASLDFRVTPSSLNCAIEKRQFVFSAFYVIKLEEAFSVTLGKLLLSQTFKG